MTRLFRGMKKGSRGRPEIGPGARTLGVRPGIDVVASSPGDPVRPGQGGLSVSPDSPMNLPSHRRPPEYQGVGRDPVWSIDTSELGPDLSYRPDPDKEGHGFVEPARVMTLDEYRGALGRTQDRWQEDGSAAAPPKQGSPSDASG